MNVYNKRNKGQVSHGKWKHRDDSFPGSQYTMEEVFWLRAIGNKVHMWPGFYPGDPRTLLVAKALGYQNGQLAQRCNQPKA